MRVSEHGFVRAKVTKMTNLSLIHAKLTGVRVAMPSSVSISEIGLKGAKLGISHVTVKAKAGN